MKQLSAPLLFGLAMLVFASTSFGESAAIPLKTATTQAAMHNPRQDLNLLKTKVSEFLATYAVSYPGKASVNVGAIDPHLKLAGCVDIQAFCLQEVGRGARL